MPRLVIFILALAICLTSWVQAQFPVSLPVSCPKISIRKEWRQYTSTQQVAYLNAVNQLKNRTSGPKGAVSQWNHDQFVNAHLQMATMNHGTATFFPWHRAFIQAYESALQALDPSITVPYWDWSLDANSMNSAPVFGPTAFGSNGDSNKADCVTDGIVKGWNITLRERNITGDCLVRQLNLPTTYGRFLMNRYYSTAANFEAFRHIIEGGPHGAIHVGIGGDMQQMTSPNDPLFFLHHGFIDKVWAKWQSLCPQFVHDFGENSLRQSLAPFPYVVGQVMEIGSNGLCFQYSLDDNDTPLTGMCPSTNNPTTSTTPAGSPNRSTTMTMTSSSPTSTPENLTNMIDISAPFWLHREMRALILVNETVPLVPITSRVAAQVANLLNAATSKKKREISSTSTARIQESCAGWSLPEGVDMSKYEHRPPLLDKVWCERQMHCDFESVQAQWTKDVALIDEENCRRFHGWPSLAA